ncbi:MAG: surface-adhesin E family protein [Alphaproteobacteria bacterium]
MKRILIGAGALLIAAGPAAAENWNSYSRSPNNVFMADVDSIATTDGVTSIVIAMVPLRTEAGDYSHSLETYEFQCGGGRWRPAGVVEIGPDGAELDRFPEEGAAWEPVRPNTMPDYLKQIACDGSRADPPTWPTIRAFIDAGRP